MPIKVNLHTEGGYLPQTIRRGNTQLVVNLFLHAKILSARDIAQKTGLSKTSVNKILRVLLDEQMIVFHGKGVSTETGGKKPDLYRLNPRYRYCISLFFTGLACNAVLVDMGLTPLHSTTHTCTQPMTRGEMVTQMVRQVYELIHSSQIDLKSVFYIALQCGGIVDDKGERLAAPIRNHHWGNNFEIKQAFKAALGLDIPVYLDNVCRFSGYHELTADPARWEKTLLVIVTSEETVGGCIIKNGQLLHGRNGLVGELGHITVDHSSAVQCGCGNNGCFEGKVSHTAVTERVRELLPEYPNSALAGTAEPCTFEALFAAADAGDPLARQVLDEVAGYFTILLYTTRLLCDPDEIIIQGTYARCGEYFNASLRRQLASHPFYSLSMGSRVTYSQSDPNAHHLGAAMYCFSHFFNVDALLGRPPGVEPKSSQQH